MKKYTRKRKYCPICKIGHANKQEICKHCELSLHNLMVIALGRSMECELDGLEYLEALISCIKSNEPIS